MMEPLSYPTPNPLRLEIRVPSGAIEVHAEDGRRTTDLRIEGERDPDDVHVSFEPDGAGRDRVRIEHRSGPIRRRRDLRIKALVPAGTEVEAETERADLVGRGRFGAVAFRSGSGDLNVDHVDADVAAASASGDLVVGTAGGDVVAHGASGDVIVGTVGGALVARSVSGDVAAHSVGGSATVTTVSGDVRIGTLGRSRTALRAVSGDIEAGIPRGVAVFLDLSSTSGDVRSDLDNAEPPPGGPDLELVAASVSGDVRVRRASHA